MSKKNKKVTHVENYAGNAYMRLKEQTPFQIAESYKQVRTNLLFSLAAQESNIILFSSALPGEGKSTTCVNLAIAMAQTGSKVLLIDADMRKPVQHKLLQLPNTKGLSTLLVGIHNEEEAIQKNVEPDLDVITSSTLPPNPTELLGSSKMETVLKKLSEKYDYIFIDAPPVNVVADALILSKFTAGVIIVTRQKYCTYPELNKAVDKVKFTGANILGIVINHTSEKNSALGKHRKYAYKGYEYVEN